MKYFVEEGTINSLVLYHILVGTTVVVIYNIFI